MTVNLITKGNAKVGALAVSTDLQVADDAYISGHLGYNVVVNDIADGASMTFTAANLLDGIVTATPTTARNIQAPTAATLIAAVTPLTATNMAFPFTIINLSASAAAMTLTVNTGTTIVGSASIASASSASFIARISSSSAIVIYRV